jgi:hypothetical protein
MIISGLPATTMEQPQESSTGNQLAHLSTSATGMQESRTIWVKSIVCYLIKAAESGITTHACMNLTSSAKGSELYNV